jgi:hypothetical protein
MWEGCGDFRRATDGPAHHPLGVHMFTTTGRRIAATAAGIVLALGAGTGLTAAALADGPAPVAESNSTCAFSFDVSTDADSLGVIPIPARCQTGDQLYKVQVQDTSFFEEAQVRPGFKRVSGMVAVFYNGNGSKVGAQAHVTGDVLLTGGEDD